MLDKELVKWSHSARMLGTARNIVKIAIQRGKFLGSGRNWRS